PWGSRRGKALRLITNGSEVTVRIGVVVGAAAASASGEGEAAESERTCTTTNTPTASASTATTPRISGATRKAVPNERRGGSAGFGGYPCEGGGAPNPPGGGAALESKWFGTPPAGAAPIGFCGAASAFGSAGRC